MISRAYSFLAAVMVAVAACGIAAVPAAAQDIDDTLGETMRSAFVYGFPVYEMMRLRWQTSENPDNSQRLVINRIGHVRGLIDHTRRVVTMPNNDTVYSLAWLDLSAGPVRVRVPDTDGRYYSLALLDIYTNNAASIGRRTIGSRAADFVVVAPEWREALPERLRVIRAPTNDALILARVLVDGPADLPTANTVQDGIRIEPLDPAARSARPGGIKPIPGDPENFLAIVNQALGLNPTPAYERVRVKSFEAVGLRPGETGAWQTLPGTVQAFWRQQFPAFLDSIKKGVAGDAPRIDGWRYPYPQIGQFGTDYEYRAVVALGGLLALEPADAVYPIVEADADGVPLTGDRRYRLHLAPGGVPADAFWSLSMYELMPDGRLFFTPNPIQRYAIGDRTRGLTKSPDGTIDIWIQHTSPGPDKESNWLPAPPGEFRMVMRAYQPRPELLDGRFRLPPVERLP